MRMSVPYLADIGYENVSTLSCRYRVGGCLYPILSVHYHAVF